MHLLHVEADDDAAERTLGVLRAASEEPLTVRRAATLADAVLAVTGPDAFDVVLLDPLHLPDGRRGLHPLRELLARAPQLPVVVLTELDDSTLAAEAIEVGAQDYVLKRPAPDGDGLARSLRFAARRGARVASLRTTGDELASFAHTVAHDLRGPLGALAGMGELLASDLPIDDATRRSFARRIERASHRLARFVGAMLVDAEQAHAPPEAVDLHRVVDWAIGLVSDEVQEAGGVVVVGELPTIWANEPALRTVLLSLLSSALDRRSPRRVPRIVVDAELEPDRVVLTVSDNGLRIERGERVRLLAPTCEGSDGAPDGRGLDLVTVNRLVGRQGGRVWLTDGDGGAGLRVRVALPRGAAADSRAFSFAAEGAGAAALLASVLGEE